MVKAYIESHNHLIKYGLALFDIIRDYLCLSQFCTSPLSLLCLFAETTAAAAAAAAALSNLVAPASSKQIQLLHESEFSISSSSFPTDFALLKRVC